MSDQPTYSFEEAIEMIRNAESWDHLCLIGQFLEEEKRLYCLFHLELLDHAIKIRDKWRSNKT